MRRRMLVIWILLVSLSLMVPILAGAGTMITLKDLVGREVSLSRNPDRIICIAPGTLRLILYLEGKDKVVGVEDIEKRFPTTRPYWIAHRDLGKLPTIGPGGPNAINKEPDLEAILSVNPQMIFISYMEKAKADMLQKKIRIPVVVLSYGPFGTFTEVIYDSLRVVGKVLAREERAEEVISYIETAKRDLIARVQGIEDSEKPNAYVGGIGFKGTHGIESSETIYPPFEWVRAKNIAKSEGKTGHLFVDKEKILAWDPEVIFIDAGGNDRVRQDYEKKPEFYQSLRAFRERKIYLLHSFNWYMTNIGTVVSDAYTVGKILYPESFSDVNLSHKADEIYSFLLGKPVYQKMIEFHGSLGAVPKYLR